MIENKYQVIDAHCHIYPEKIVDRAVAGTDAFYSTRAACRGVADELLEIGDRVGIDRFIVQSVATTPKQVSSINHFIAESVAQSDGHFTGLGTLHPDSEDMEADVNEILSLGLKGVKLHPDIQKIEIDDPRMHKIYKLCEGKLPILIHTGDYRYDFSNPNRMIPILEQYPNLTVIGAHFGGWSIWEEATEKLNKYKNFLVDCSSSLYAITPQKAKELICIYGVERVLFGTDYPLWRPEEELERFMQIELTEAEREDILYNNAAKLFFNVTR